MGSDAAPPEEPIRFGLVDLLTSTLLVSGKALLLMRVTLDRDSEGIDLERVVGCLIFALLVTGCASFLTLRLAAEHGLERSWKRLLVFLALDLSLTTVLPMLFVLPILAAWSAKSPRPPEK